MSTRWKIALGTATGVIVVVVALAALKQRPTPAPSGSRTGLATTISIEPFRIPDAAPPGWSSAVFAESLATRLSRTPGLTVREASVSLPGRAEFTLTGEVALREHRLVIAARLHSRTAPDAVWTATYWRDPLLTTGLVDDVAGAVAEAVYGELARRAVSDRRGTP